MHKATIVIEHPKASVMEKTVKPESAVEIPRTSVRISRQEDKVTILIESGDVNGLRAAVNSYLRWMEMAARISERTGE